MDSRMGSFIVFGVLIAAISGGVGYYLGSQSSEKVEIVRERPNENSNTEGTLSLTMERSTGGGSVIDSSEGASEEKSSGAGPAMDRREFTGPLMVLPNGTSVPVDNFDAWIGEVTPEVAARFYEQVMAMPAGEIQDKAMAQLMRRWGMVDGENAFVVANSVEGREGLKLVGLAAAGWARSDAPEAWKALMEASNFGAISGVPLGPTIKEIAQVDLGMALDLISDITRPSSQRYSMRPLIEMAEAEDSFSSVISLAQGIEDKNTRDLVTRELFQGWSRSDLESALDGLTTWEDVRFASEAMDGILNGWAQEDGAAAFDFATTDTSGMISMDTKIGVARSWLTSVSAYEATEIGERIGQLEDSDQYVRSLVQPLISADPEMTFGLVEEMEDPALKHRTRTMAVAIWIRNDVDTAGPHIIQHFNDKEFSGATSALLNSYVKNGSDLEPIFDRIDEIEDEKSRRRSFFSLAMMVNGKADRLSPEEQARLRVGTERFADEIGRVEVTPDGSVRLYHGKGPSNTAPSDRGGSKTAKP